MCLNIGMVQLESSAKWRSLIMDFSNISDWLFTPSILITILIYTVLIPYFVFRPIARKAGYSGWWAITILIPLLNIIIIWVFAFAKWPALKVNKSLQSED